MPGPSRPRSPRRRRPPADAPGRQYAVCATGKSAAAVLKALQALGDVQPYPPADIFVLDPAPATPEAEVAAVLDKLRSRGQVRYVTPVLRDPTTGSRQILTDEITVRFTSVAVARSALDELTRDERLTVARRNEFVPEQYTLRVEEASGTRTREVAERLQERSDVDFAAPNYIVDIQR